MERINVLERILVGIINAMLILRLLDEDMGDHTSEMDMWGMGPWWMIIGVILVILIILVVVYLLTNIRRDQTIIIKT